MHSRAIIIAALPVLFAFGGTPAAAQTVAVDNGTDTTAYGSAGPVVSPGTTTGTPSVVIRVPSPTPGAVDSVLRVSGNSITADVYAPNLNGGSLNLTPDYSDLIYFDIPNGVVTGMRADSTNAYIGAYAKVSGAQLVGLRTDLTTLQNTFLGVTNTAGIVNTGDIATTTLSTTGNATIGGSLSVAGTTQTHGIDNNGNVISGVAAGQVATDAANVGQLNALAADQAAINNVQASVNAAQTAVNDRQASINAAQANTNAQVQSRLDENRKVASTGSAIAMAAGSIPALEAGKQAGLGVGVGNYDGRSALAIGVAARVNEALQLKFNVGTGAGGKASVGAGGMWSW
jgi:hypothetical protein